MPTVASFVPSATTVPPLMVHAGLDKSGPSARQKIVSPWPTSVVFPSGNGLLSLVPHVITPGPTPPVRSVSTLLSSFFSWVNRSPTLMPSSGISSSSAPNPSRPAAIVSRLSRMRLRSAAGFVWSRSNTSKSLLNVASGVTLRLLVSGSQSTSNTSGHSISTPPLASSEPLTSTLTLIPADIRTLQSKVTCAEGPGRTSFPRNSRTRIALRTGADPAPGPTGMPVAGASMSRESISPAPAAAIVNTSPASAGAGFLAASPEAVTSRNPSFPSKSTVAATDTLAVNSNAPGVLSTWMKKRSNSEVAKSASSPGVMSAGSSTRRTPKVTSSENCGSIVRLADPVGVRPTSPAASLSWSPKSTVLARKSSGSSSIEMSYVSAFVAGSYATASVSEGSPSAVSRALLSSCAFRNLVTTVCVTGSGSGSGSVNSTLTIGLPDDVNSNRAFEVGFVPTVAVDVPFISTVPLSMLQLTLVGFFGAMA